MGSDVVHREVTSSTGPGVCCVTERLSYVIIMEYEKVFNIPVVNPKEIELFIDVQQCDPLTPHHQLHSQFKDFGLKSDRFFK